MVLVVPSGSSATLSGDIAGGGGTGYVTVQGSWSPGGRLGTSGATLKEIEIFDGKTLTVSHDIYATNIYLGSGGSGATLTTNADGINLGTIDGTNGFGSSVLGTLNINNVISTGGAIGSSTPLAAININNGGNFSVGHDITASTLSVNSGASFLPTSSVTLMTDTLSLADSSSALNLGGHTFTLTPYTLGDTPSLSGGALATTISGAGSTDQNAPNTSNVGHIVASNGINISSASTVRVAPLSSPLSGANYYTFIQGGPSNSGFDNLSVSSCPTDYTCNFITVGNNLLLKIQSTNVPSPVNPITEAGSVAGLSALADVLARIYDNPVGTAQQALKALFVDKSHEEVVDMMESLDALGADLKTDASSLFTMISRVGNAISEHSAAGATPALAAADSGLAMAGAGSVGSARSSFGLQQQQALKGLTQGALNGKALMALEDALGGPRWQDPTAAQQGHGIDIWAQVLGARETQN